MGMNTTLKNRQILDNAFGVLGIEFMAAAQALELPEFTPGKGSLKAREVIRKYVAHLEVDRPLYKNHYTMMDLVKTGAILDEVREGSGQIRLKIFNAKIRRAQRFLKGFFANFASLRFHEFYLFSQFNKPFPAAYPFEKQAVSK